MPAKRSPARKRGARSRGRRSWRDALPELPVLEQRHYDLAGLALVALGVFLAFVLYVGWEGGRGGDALVDGATYVLGLLAYAVPVVLLAAGVLLVMRPVLPAGRPFGTGGACLLAAAALALAAGTLGFGPGGADVRWEAAWVEERGGVVGEAMYWALSSLLGRVGAHIAAIFLFVAGLLLLTGATVSGVLAGTRRHALHTGRRLRATSADVTAVLARRGADPVTPPEPDPGDLVLHATHVEARSLDAAERYPDLYDAPDSAEADDDGGDAQPGSDPEPIPPDGGPTTEEHGVVAEDAPGPQAAGEPEPEGKAGAQQRLTPQGRLRRSETESPDFVWRVPKPSALKRSTGDATRPDTSGQERTAAQLIETLGHFGIEAKVVGTVTGPHITRYELRLAPGTKVGKVAQLKDDLAYALAATEIRILAPIPGKQAVGVEVPNLRRRIVHLGDVFQDPPADWSPLTVWLGKEISGKAIGADLAKMPHLLVAGTTGSGKSGCVNAMLVSILLRATPHEVRMVLVDPKQVELNHYDSIPHLLTPVITSPRKAANALQNLVREMEERYGMMSLARTRSLHELNRTRARRGEPPLPYILCVIDELADLMMVAPADVEDSIIRLAQKARAVGIHLVLATQSPRVDVITGMIKANVPSRIAFSVSSQTDSRVILDQNGAEALLGQGDMLFSPVGSSRLQRIQGAYVDEEQIATITDYWRRQGEPEFREELLEEVESDEPEQAGGEEEFSPDEDPLLDEAIALVASMGTASTSMLQRRLRLGYTRAGRLIDMLERRGVISGYEGSKPRQVLITEADVPRVLANLAEASNERATAVADPAGDADDE